MTAFDRGIAVERSTDGLYRGEIAPGWRAVGPNGGYIASIVLNACRTEAALNSPSERTPRSLNVTYLAAPSEGAIEIEVTVEKAGRSVTFVSARLTQHNKTMVLGRGVFATAREGPEFSDITLPDVAPLEESLPRPEGAAGMPEIVERFDTRFGYGHAPFSQGAAAISGGWIRLAEDRPVDHLLLTMFTDAWMPSVFARTNEMISVPTLDLTVYYRAAHPEAEVEPGKHCIVTFESQIASEGFVEEDGAVWSPGGKLLAQSRQLALIRKLEG